MIPSKQENPDGLHRRYDVTKADGTPTAPGAVYFVLRLDDLGDDKGHIHACRKAALAYADNAPEHMKRTASELRAMVMHFDPIVNETIELTPRMVEAISKLRRLKNAQAKPGGEEWSERDVMAVALWRWVEELEARHQGPTGRPNENPALGI